MCGEVVAAPLSLQDTVYPILRKKSLHFCEKSKKFLKLCTAVRKKYKMKRLRRKNEHPQSKPDGFASSLGEGASGVTGMFAVWMESFCLPSADRDAPLGQRQGGVFRLPPPYLWTPLTPQRAKGCTPLTILKKKSKHKKASAAPVGASALTLFSLLH